MHMTFQRNGVREEGIILAVSQDRMRIAARGHGDTIELTLADGSWRDERGRRIEVETLVAMEHADPRIYADLYPRTATAGTLL